VALNLKKCSALTSNAVWWCSSRLLDAEQQTIEKLRASLVAQNPIGDDVTCRNDKMLDGCRVEMEEFNLSCRSLCVLKDCYIASMR